MAKEVVHTMTPAKEAKLLQQYLGMLRDAINNDDPDLAEAIDDGDGMWGEGLDEDD